MTMTTTPLDAARVRAIEADIEKPYHTTQGILAQHVKDLLADRAHLLQVADGQDAQNLTDVVAYLGIEDSFTTPLEAILEMRNELYRFIEHGDEKHRQWLKDKLDEYFVSERSIRSQVRAELGLPEVI